MKYKNYKKLKQNQKLLIFIFDVDLFNYTLTLNEIEINNINNKRILYNMYILLNFILYFY